MSTPSTHAKRLLAALWLFGFATTTSCTSMFTAIGRDANGDYVITGNSAGNGGFVWVCSYVPVAQTLTVKKPNK